MSSDQPLETLLRQCCGSDAWVQAVLATRASDEPADVLRAADAAWASLDEAGWKEAFAAHAAVVPTDGDAPTQDAARVAVRLYEQRFGHPFVTAAAVRAADELLMRVRIRLGNEVPVEWKIACDEQRRATRLRLDALLRRNAP